MTYFRKSLTHRLIKVAICGEESFYVLKYSADVFANASPDEITDDGVEDTFEVVG